MSKVCGACSSERIFVERIHIYLVAAQDAFGHIYIVGSRESNEDARASVAEGDALLSYDTDQTLRIFAHGLNMCGQILPRTPYVLVESEQSFHNSTGTSFQ